MTAHEESAPPPQPKPKLPAAIAATPAVTDAQLAAMLAQLDGIAVIIAADATPLTIQQRRGLAKMRPGAEPLAPQIMKLAERYGVVLPGATAASVKADLALVQQLASLQSRLGTVLGLIGDVSAEARSRVWRAAGAAYSALVRLVPQYPALQRELAPMATLLAVKHKDAPTALRKQEAKTLSKTRATRKGKKAQAGATAQEAGTPQPPVAPAPAPAPVPVAAAAHPVQVTSSSAVGTGPGGTPTP
ncbi:MAG TPA: hypothetical protein VGI39_01090 [Polyangiaceae bacterium]